MTEELGAITNADMNTQTPINTLPVLHFVITPDGMNEVLKSSITGRQPARARHFCGMMRGNKSDEWPLCVNNAQLP